MRSLTLVFAALLAAVVATCASATVLHAESNSNSSGIAVLQFRTPHCVTAGAEPVKYTFQNGGCSSSMARHSVHRFCVDGVLNVMTFNASDVCSGMPSGVGTYPVGTCYEVPVDGTSFMVAQCV